MFHKMLLNEYMEMLGGKGDENIDAQHMAEQSTCAYRDLNDEAKAAEFLSQYLEDLDEDSPLSEEMVGKPICDRPSCLLNLRIALCYMLSPGKPEAIEDVDWAVPPDCEWRNDTGIHSEP